MLPASELIKPFAWDAGRMQRHKSWRFVAASNVSQDIDALVAWASQQPDPIGVLQKEAVPTPVLTQLGSSLAHELDHGSGVAWVRGFAGVSEQALRLVFLKIGLELGATIDTYGRLYDVTDSGESYRDKPIPVSQTRESTGMHTDSSNRDTHPRIIGLGCVRQAKQGGKSRVVSAAHVHELMREQAPALLEMLYGDFVRDLVTPNSRRDLARLAANCFPIFSYDHKPVIRYMRYWIEKGHERLGEPLSIDVIRAFDCLDTLLADPKNILFFRMEPGDLLFIDNTTILHDRDAYVDDQDAPRLLLRLWLDRGA
jgi:alpha-ketoglutarate-dependent taurine dioxygenase